MALVKSSLGIGIVSLSSVSTASPAYSRLRRYAGRRMYDHFAEQFGTENMREIVKLYITKIYAHIDGSITVNVGVRLNGKCNTT